MPAHPFPWACLSGEMGRQEPAGEADGEAGAPPTPPAPIPSAQGAVRSKHVSKLFFILFIQPSDSLSSFLLPACSYFSLGDTAPGRPGVRRQVGTQASPLPGPRTLAGCFTSLSNDMGLGQDRPLSHPFHIDQMTLRRHFTTSLNWFLLCNL